MRVLEEQNKIEDFGCGLEILGAALAGAPAG